MTDDIRGTAIGYAVNLTMDYGSGRQVHIAGTLPPEADLKQFNDLLDTLRKTTNRQQNFIWLREREAKLAASKKMVATLEAMISEYEKTLEKEMQRLEKEPLHSSGKQRTQISAQIENMRSQAVNFRLDREKEISQHKAEADISEVIIAGVKKEIAEIDGANDNNGG